MVDKLGLLLLIGLFAGFFGGGYLVISFAPQASLSLTALITFCFTIFGGLVGVFIAFYFDKKSDD